MQSLPLRRQGNPAVPAQPYRLTGESRYPGAGRRGPVSCGSGPFAFAPTPSFLRMQSLPLRRQGNPAVPAQPYRLTGESRYPGAGRRGPVSCGSGPFTFAPTPSFLRRQSLPLRRQGNPAVPAQPYRLTGESRYPGAGRRGPVSCGSGPFTFAPTPSFLRRQSLPLRRQGNPAVPAQPYRLTGESRYPGAGRRGPASCGSGPFTCRRACFVPLKGLSPLGKHLRQEAALDLARGSARDRLHDVDDARALVVGELRAAERH